MTWEIAIRDIIQMKIPNQVIHLPRFAQPCFLLDATHNYIWKLPSTNHSPGICRRVLFSLKWGLLSSFTTLMVVAILPWYSPYLSSLAHVSYSTRFLCFTNNPTEPGLTSCIMQLLPPTARASLLLLRYKALWDLLGAHTLTLDSPIQAHEATGGQHGVLLAYTPPTSLVTRSVPCDSSAVASAVAALEFVPQKPRETMSHNLKYGRTDAQ